MKIEAVILAAGLGTRMESELPKVLHLLGGRPLIAWTVAACQEATVRKPYVVVGPDAEVIQHALSVEAHFIEQVERLGTGHALLQAADQLRGKSSLVLVVNADLPLLRPESLRCLIEQQESNQGPITLLSAISDQSRLRSGRTGQKWRCGRDRRAGSCHPRTTCPSRVERGGLLLPSRLALGSSPQIAAFPQRRVLPDRSSSHGSY